MTNTSRFKRQKIKGLASVQVKTFILVTSSKSSSSNLTEMGRGHHVGAGLVKKKADFSLGLAV